MNERINTVAARLKALRQEIKELKQFLKTSEDEEKILERDLLREMQDMEADQLHISGLKLVRVEEEIATPDPDHWQDIFDWIASTANWQVVRKQLNITGVRELAQIGESIPFVELGKIEKLKVADLRISE